MLVDPARLLLLALLVAGVAPILAAVGWSLRAAWHNAVERCGQCAGPLPGAGGAPALVQGRLCCARCAARLQRRVRVATVALAAFGAAAVTGAVVGSLMDDALPAAQRIGLPALVAAEFALFLWGGLAWMRRADRRAAARLAAEQERAVALGRALYLRGALAVGATARGSVREAVRETVRETVRRLTPFAGQAVVSARRATQPRPMPAVEG